jgi:hypothetical protein
MELATLGRVAVPPDPIPIREGRTLLGRCSVSFANTWPSEAMCEATNSESSRYDYRERLLGGGVQIQTDVLCRSLASAPKIPCFCLGERYSPCSVSDS